MDRGGVIAVSIGPGGQVDEQARSRIKPLQNCSLCITAAAEFHLLEDRLLLLIHHKHPCFAAFRHDRHGGDEGLDGAAACLKVHVGGHPDQQFFGGIHERKFHLEGDHVLLFHSPRSDLADLGLEALIGKGVHADLCGLADGDPSDVAFRNACRNL